MDLDTDPVSSSTWYRGIVYFRRIPRNPYDDPLVDQTDRWYARVKIVGWAGTVNL
jgi:hypothetical protein